MRRGARLLATAAGLAGAAGVALAAVAAHKVPLPLIASAASMLQFHAVAALAVVAVASGVARPLSWLVAGGTLLSGAILFAAAVALPQFGIAILPSRAAPVGGSLVIVGWLLVAWAAAFAQDAR